jgi:hypothetical protein
MTVSTGKTNKTLKECSRVHSLVSQQKLHDFDMTIVASSTKGMAVGSQRVNSLVSQQKLCDFGVTHFTRLPNRVLVVRCRINFLERQQLLHNGDETFVTAPFKNKLEGTTTKDAIEELRFQELLP